jgi:hypothetical protein
LLFGEQTERPCEHGEKAHNHKRNISDPRPFALSLFGFVQGCLAFGLSCSHRFELFALGTGSRLRLLFARADEVEV